MLKRKPTRIELRGDKEDWDELEQMKQARANSSTKPKAAIDPFPEALKSKPTVENRIGYTDQQREALLHN
jgi:hypothetical protein